MLNYVILQERVNMPIFDYGYYDETGFHAVP
jgi:hypothetical protein